MCRLFVQYGDHQSDNDMQMIYNETCLNRTLNKPKSCMNRILNEVLMQEIFVNLICAKPLTEISYWVCNILFGVIFYYKAIISDLI
jgi:hypothetical protein